MDRLKKWKKSGKGGNLNFITGSGGAGSGKRMELPGDCGDITFQLGSGAQGDTREVMRITAEGFFIEGRQVKAYDDREIYETFRRWLRAAMAHREEKKS